MRRIRLEAGCGADGSTRGRYQLINGCNSVTRRACGRAIIFTASWLTNHDVEVTTVRINIESVFEQFDPQLSAALAKAALETVPGMTTKTALRLYEVFRRNAIRSLSPWERVPATALTGDTITGASPSADGGIALPPLSDSGE
jgi:hypothetical protein